jgi:hypothetical protein|tara:strand:+ start:378 stop:494 length:117 start_codon:yes stop_codon:yes gene_type:complete
LRPENKIKINIKAFGEEVNIENNKYRSTNNEKPGIVKG